jgi:hypothetical protein
MAPSPFMKRGVDITNFYIVLEAPRTSEDVVQKTFRHPSGSIFELKSLRRLIEDILPIPEVSRRTPEAPSNWNSGP